MERRVLVTVTHTTDDGVAGGQMVEPVTSGIGEGVEEEDGGEDDGE